MRLRETEIERAERRVREAEANVERQKLRLAVVESGGKSNAFRSGREVLQAFKDTLGAMKQRLRDARRRHLANPS